MNTLSRLKTKLSHNSPLRLVSDAFRRVGLAVIPYYVMRETAADAGAAATWPQTITFTRLDSNDLDALPRTELAYMTPQWLQQRVQQGDVCFALKQEPQEPQEQQEEHGQQVAAICWASRAQALLIFESVPLQSNEAYIYAAHTFSEFRGRGLMPLLRGALCRELDAEGAQHMYSVVDALNRPACKVYEKMSASRVQSGVALSLFGRINRRVVLENLEPGFAQRRELPE